MDDAAMVEGLICRRSRHDPAATIRRLETLLSEAGVKIFARIDFAADAQAAGLKLAPELMLIFGNPRAGTPLMAERPTVGIDLPLKLLAWMDADGRSWVAFNDPAYVVERHGLPETFARTLAAVTPLIERACNVV
ncbi:MAG: DUF302 domain-containing protein [Steroidobacteraceae bacterium]